AQEAALQEALGGVQGGARCREGDAHGQTPTSHLAHRWVARELAAEPVAKARAASCTRVHEGVALEDLERGEGRSAAEGMSEERPRVDGLLARRAPGLHHVESAETGAHGQPAAERLAEADQVWLGAVLDAREPGAGP